MNKIICTLLLAAPFTALAQDSLKTETAVKDSLVTLTPGKSYKPVNPDPRQVYKMNWGADIPLAAIGTGWSLYAFTQIYSKDRSTEDQILALDKNDIPRIDRRGADVYHPKASEVADMIFYGSMPLPIILMLDKSIRKDAFKTAYLYLESMAVTGLLYTSAVYFKDRYRPYAYNENVPMSERTRGGAKNSFFAGHVALVGTSTFFIAKMLNDHHPHSKWKWVPFTLAGITTGTVAYLRYRGGEHFTTDIMLGTLVGTLSGILVPHFHKNKNLQERRLSFTSGYNFNTPMFGVVYKLGTKF